ncbi:MAG: helicase C-terminal domain-containing protein [Candidatus Hodarchaeota archaeon]
MVSKYYKVNTLGELRLLEELPLGHENKLENFNAQLGRFRFYFSFDPYPDQLFFMKDLDHLVNSNETENPNRIGLFEAPTGFGKTAAALAALLPYGKRIVFLTRTHTQMAQIAKEIRRINNIKSLTLDCVVRGSRRWLCLVPEIRKCKEQEAIEKCIAGLHSVKIKESRITEYMNENETKSDTIFEEDSEDKKRLVCKNSGISIELPVRVPINVPTVADIDSLVQYGKDNHFCPYFLSKLLTRHRKIIISAYNYLFISDLPIWKNILVFDEAHNIEKVCKDAYSFVISEVGIEEAIQEMSFCGGFSALNLLELLEEFLDVFHQLKPNRSIQNVTKHELLDLFTKYGLPADFFEILQTSMDDFTTTRKELISQRGRNFPVELMKSYEVLTFLRTLIEDPVEPFVGFLERKTQGTMLSWVCLDPSRAFTEIRHRDPHAIVLMSGTLSPMQSLTQFLQIPQAVTRSYSSIVTPANIRIFTLGTGTRGIPLSTKYTRRKDLHIAYGYGKTAELIIARVPNGSLVFFPSYSLMTRFLSIWRRSGIIDSLAQVATLFFESSHTDKKLINEYKEIAKKQRAVLFAVCRGTLAEGVDFPDASGRAALIIGVPYPDLSDPRIKAQQEYYETKFPKVKMGWRWYMDEAVRAVNQTLGRVWRHKDDFALGFLLDTRYYSHPIRIRLSPWLIRHITFPGKRARFSKTLGKIDKFFAQKKTR